jgi:uncharacterized damage-inducible protein DinB
MYQLHPSEYAPYFNRYTSLVTLGPVPGVLAANGTVVANFFRSLPQALHGHRYAPGKWTIKDILQHLTDTERVMAYRALAAARGDAGTELSLMDEDLYAAGTDTTSVSLEELLEEYQTVRQATVQLFNRLPTQKLQQTCHVNGQDTTARAWGYIIAGHGLHHMNVIRGRYM